MLSGCWTAGRHDDAVESPATQPASVAPRDAPTAKACTDDQFRAFARRVGATLCTVRIEAKRVWILGAHTCDALPDRQCEDRARNAVRPPDGYRLDRVELIAAGPVVGYELVIDANGTQVPHRVNTKTELALFLRQTAETGVW
ncbi:MAG: hypothetical protein SFX73_37780 [Kofleriaceae bacterium]|nr:hypothetical protein [Kofleriaceae bacterium]